MNTMFATFKKSGRAALVALALGAAAVTAMPAQAAEPSFNFQLGIGNNGGVSGFERNNNGRRDFDRWKPINRCLTNSQVERGLSNYGFDDADVVRSLSRNRVLVVAEWNGRFYSMTVDKCSGEVYNVKRLRRGYDFFDGPPKNGPRGGMGFEKDGFSFQFNF